MVLQESPTVTEDTIQYDDSQEPQYKSYREKAQSRIEAADVLVLTDGDADGIASAALVKDVFTELTVKIIPVGPHGSAYKYTNRAIEDVVEYGREGMTVFMLDTCLDEQDKFDFYKNPLEKMGEMCSVYFFDHHMWDNATPKETVEEISTHAEFEMSSQSWMYDETLVKERATVKMVYDYFTGQGVSFSPFVRDRVFAVSVADTWEKEDDTFIHPHAGILSESIQEITFNTHLNDRYEFAWWGYREWVNEFLTDSSALNSPSSHINEFASRYKHRIEQEVNFIQSNPDFFSEHNINGVKTGVVFGDVSPNEVSEALQNDGFELVVTLRPNGGCSFRSVDSVSACNVIAQNFDGGGHENASGGHLFELSGFDKNEYVESKGNSVKETVIQKIGSAL